MVILSEGGNFCLFINQLICSIFDALAHLPYVSLDIFTLTINKKNELKNYRNFALHDDLYILRCNFTLVWLSTWIERLFPLMATL